MHMYMCTLACSEFMCLEYVMQVLLVLGTCGSVLVCVLALSVCLFMHVCPLCIDSLLQNTLPEGCLCDLCML